jgi:hypothetical protein
VIGRGRCRTGSPRAGRRHWKKKLGTVVRPSSCSPLARWWVQGGSAQKRFEAKVSKQKLEAKANEGSHTEAAPVASPGTAPTYGPSNCKAHASTRSGGDAPGAEPGDQRRRRCGEVAGSPRDVALSPVHRRPDRLTVGGSWSIWRGHSVSPGRLTPLSTVPRRHSPSSRERPRVDGRRLSVSVRYMLRRT